MTSSLLPNLHKHEFNVNLVIQNLNEDYYEVISINKIPNGVHIDLW